MFKPKIAIFGSSGFVGSALVERLFFDKGYDFVPFIHSFGNAARLARLPIQLRPIDILNFDQVSASLSGCNVVVNCSRGESGTMIKGLRNIINASQKNNIKKFIHIGSIAIYGNNPPPESSREVAAPEPVANSYGAMKLKQDKMILKLHASGIPSIILCPSNISGPHSIYLLAAAKGLLSNEVVLVDEGKYPTNLIHIDNLIQAIVTAIDSDKGWGERYFINETERTTWKEFYEELKEILGVRIELPSISRDEVLKEMSKSKTGFRFTDSLRLLSSKEFRSVMSKFPVFKGFSEFAVKMFLRQNFDVRAKIKNKLTGPVIIRKETKSIDVNSSLLRPQIRQFYHSPEKIISKMNYFPLLNYQQRKESIASWFKYINMMQ